MAIMCIAIGTVTMKNRMAIRPTQFRRRGLIDGWAS
jgi:hypothetical protein